MDGDDGIAITSLPTIALVSFPETVLRADPWNIRRNDLTCPRAQHGRRFWVWLTPASPVCLRLATEPLGL